jgi:O-antigen/teichoic acid export membrane protein
MRVQHGAILRRQMRFGVLALVDLTALVVGTASGIVLAWWRRDYWGLAAMHWGSCLTACIGIWLACGWRPSLPGRLAAVRSQLHFGTRFTGSQVLLFLTGNLDNVLIGRFWGAGELGLYARAYQLLLLPVQQVSGPMGQVAMPAMSRLQAEPERLRYFYKRTLNFMALLIVPFMVTIGALSHEIVLLLLGPSWVAVGAIFKPLAVAGLVEPFMSSAGWIMVANGRADRLLTWCVLYSPVLLLSFVIGLPWGGLGVAIAYACARWLLVLPCFWFALRGTIVGIMDVFTAVWCPFCLGGLLCLVVSTARFVLVSRSPLAVIGLSSLAGLVVLLIALGLWSRARTELMGLIRVFRQLLVPGLAQDSSLPVQI